jgi:hypothetical protein
LAPLGIVNQIVTIHGKMNYVWPPTLFCWIGAAMAATAGAPHHVSIPLRSGETVHVDELPEEAEDMVGLLTEEMPPIETWLEVAVSGWAPQG